MFGTFIKRGELIIYPFLEAYVDDNFEYKPDEFGAQGAIDYRGLPGEGGLLLVNYGLTDNFAFEIDVAGITGKVGVTGRAALLAFFLKDLVAPIGPVEAP